MATLDPKKKKPDSPLGAAPPNLATRIGQGVGQLGRAAGVTLALPTMARNAVNRQVSGVADNVGTGITSGFTGQPIPQPKPAPLKIIEGTAPAAPARNPASPGASAGAAPPAGGVPAPPPRPAHPGVTFNDGSGATYTTGEGRTGILPAGVAVKRQSNGVNAFGATGASVADATGNRAPLGFSPPTSPAPNLTVPGIDLPSVNTGRVSAAERERSKLASGIADQLRLMNISPNGLNSRGKRQLFAQLLGEQAGLTRQAGDLAGSAAGQQLSAATQAGTSTQGNVVGNQQALLGDLNTRDLAALREQGDNTRLAFTTAAERTKPERITDNNGNVVSVTGTSSQAVNGPDGKPLNVGVPKDSNQASADSILSAYNAQLKAIADATEYGKQPDFSALNASPLGQRAQQVIGAGNSGVPGAASDVPAGYTVVGTKNGKRIFKDANGKTYSE